MHRRTDRWKKWHTEIVPHLIKIMDIFHVIYIIPYWHSISAKLGQVWWVNELWFKRYIQEWTLPHVVYMYTHHYVTDLLNRGMARNTKTWISWEQNINFLRNKKILNMCFRWYILRSYHFVAEVTFKHNLYLKMKFVKQAIYIMWSKLFILDM